MAKVRSRKRNAVRAAARRFLRQAFKTTNSLDTSQATNAHWIKHANLMPVLRFLASQQLGAE